MKGKDALRQRLMTYPGATEESVDQLIEAYEVREEEKKGLIEHRGMSNAMAEAFLDKMGYPRPPGWHSVLFYPGSNRPRTLYIVILVVVAIGAALL